LVNFIQKSNWFVLRYIVPYMYISKPNLFFQKLHVLYIVPSYMFIVAACFQTSILVVAAGCL